MSRRSLLPFLALALFQLFAFGGAASIPRHRPTSTKTCGYETCHAVDPHKLNIHLVPHTHDDVGWLKTVDQYYYGSRSTIQKAGVQYIIDSAIQALLANPERRFIYVETAFLWKWWVRQSEKVKEDVRNLIDEGRLEIIGGGWSMNDEAVTHYHSLVDQFTWGFRRLNDTLGTCARPRIGWQIDPFGHSREQASMFAQMGFDGMLFGRIDYQDKSKRLREKSMEFIWEGSPSLGKRANLFTAAMYNTYSPPPGFCFDILCADEPIIDDEDLPDYNVPERIESFLNYAHKQSTYFRTNNIILTMGGDFTYQHAEMYYMNLDKLIRYVNERNGSTVNAFYSTPSCYLKALHDANMAWPTKSDDFFPYASDPHAYWTGYFSSRPTLKFFERQGNNLLQISKQLSALTDLKDHDKHLEHLREVMGVMQHHDAVTGTEKQLVAEDYARLMYESMHHAEDLVAHAVKKWSKKGSEGAPEPSYKMYSCLQLNISVCEPSEENQNFVVPVYNPLGRQVTTYVRLPVQGKAYTVRDLSTDSEVVSQLVPIAEAVTRITGRMSKATKEVVFRATVPAMGYKAYVVMEKTEQESHQLKSANSIESESFDISVNDAGQVVVHNKKQKDMDFVQSFQYYEAEEGNNRVFKNRSSGAYIFRPKTVTANNFAYTGHYVIHKGPVVQEIHQTINEWISQVVRVYTGEEHVEFDWLVGPIPVHDKIGKEIVTKYTSNLNTNGEFYTDLNGREMLKRKRNYRPTWELELHEPISGNYYPLTSKMSLKDEDKHLKLSALVDRAQGGSSINDGEMEIMLHRRLLRDDAFGVGEALNETAFGTGLIVRGTHYLFGGSTKKLDALTLKEKNLALELELRSWPLVMPIEHDAINTWCNMSKLQNSALAKVLPPNVHILTLEPWKDGTLLLRLEHIFEVGEALQLSQPVEVNIQDLFSTFTITSIEETTLGANQWLKDSNPLQWEPETNDVLQEQETNSQSVEIQGNVINVLLKPMEIRTFILTVARHA
ncbi:hypothetical protein KM043_002203 [Ampulex compressa]|nr:hypothetical protein KM043_002203 [Ampulex compressa]